MAVTGLLWEIYSGFLHQVGGFRWRRIQRCHYTYPRPTWLPWQRKFENFNRKFAITGLLWEICSWFLHQVGGFRWRRIQWCHLHLPQTDPVTWLQTNQNRDVNRQDISYMLVVFPCNGWIVGSHCRWWSQLQLRRYTGCVSTSCGC